MAASDLDDDGYISPEFDLPDVGSSEDEEEPPPPSKRSRTVASQSERNTLEDDEELALQLLRGSRR